MQHTEGFDISSVGYDDFNGQLSHGISAHPKVDPKTGDLHTFGYEMMGPEGAFYYSRFDKEQKLQSHLKIKLAGHRMIHDFVITDNYVVIPDLPFEICPIDAITGGQPFFQLKKSAPIRYGLLPKNAKSEKETVWFDFAQEECHFCFHFANGYETKENGDDIVVIDCAMVKKFDSFFKINDEHPLYKNNEETPHLHQIKLNMTTGKHSIEALVPEMGADWVMINPSVVGQKYRYIYAASFPEDGLSQKALDSCMQDGFFKYDLQERRIVKQVKYEGEKMSGEVQFAARDNATSEDDGYLMTFVYDPHNESTQFCVWDAQTFELVSKVNTKERVPHGFHGTWVPSSELAETDPLA